LNRRVAWVWPVLLAAGLVFVAAFRMWSGWATRPMTASPGATEGVIGGGADDAAAAARRLPQLERSVAETRQALADLAAAAARKREQADVLRALRQADQLTECPPFLHEDATVRALQQIIREADGATPAGDDRQARLAAAAAVARERLRTRLTALHDQLRDEVQDLEDRAAALGQRLRIESRDLERLRQQVDRRPGGATGGAKTGGAAPASRLRLPVPGGAV